MIKNLCWSSWHCVMTLLQVLGSRMWRVWGKMANWDDYRSSKQNKKSNVLPTHIMKAYRQNRGLNPLILNLRAKWRRVVKLTPRLAGTLRDSQRFGEEKSLLPSQGFEPSDIPVSSQVSMLTALPYLFLTTKWNLEEQSPTRDRQSPDSQVHKEIGAKLKRKRYKIFETKPNLK